MCGICSFSCHKVRKAGQEALLILLEQDLVFQNDVENKVCPILLDLSAPDSDDEYKVEAVNVSAKGRSGVGRELCCIPYLEMGFVSAWIWDLDFTYQRSLKV